jgi:hypothetical protein
MRDRPIWQVVIFAILLVNQSIFARGTSMSFAEASWSIVITEEKSVIAVGRITAADKPRLMNLNQLRGRAEVHIEQELTPNRWTGPRDIVVEYIQLDGAASRSRAGGGGWNGVNIQPGTVLLLGMEAQASYIEPVELEAVSQLSSDADPRVRSVQRALAVETATDPQQRKLLLIEALNSEEPILMSYVHYALGRMQRIPRADAVMLEMKVLLDRKRSSRQRLAAESTLELELWASHSPGDEINRNIVRVLVHVLSQADPEVQSETTMSLYRLLISAAPAEPGAANAYQLMLLHGADSSEVRTATVALRGEASNPSIGAQATQLASVLSGVMQ